MFTRLNIVGSIFSVLAVGLGATDLAHADATPSTLCADIWQPGNTIPADYTGCDYADGTRHTSPFEPRVCFGDLSGPDYVKSPDLQLSARLGGEVLEGEEQARMLATCLGMSDWLFDTETVNA